MKKALFEYTCPALLLLFGAVGLLLLLVAGEVALATMLAIGGGLAMKSFASLQKSKPGHTARSPLTFRMRLPADYIYRGDHERAEFYRRILGSLADLAISGAELETERVSCRWSEVGTDVPYDSPWIQQAR